MRIPIACGKHSVERPADMTRRSDPLLRWVLRLVGTASLLALPCALMPLGWMDATHQGLGLGPLPTDPIVSYLARSTSLFYALLGALMWLVSFDLQRHRIVISFLGCAMLAFGLILLWIDSQAGLPLWWTLYEGPWDAAIGIAILILNRPRPFRSVR